MRLILDQNASSVLNVRVYLSERPAPSAPSTGVSALGCDFERKQNDYPLGIFLCEHLHAARVRDIGLSSGIEVELCLRPHRRLAVAPLL